VPLPLAIDPVKIRMLQQVCALGESPSPGRRRPPGPPAAHHYCSTLSPWTTPVDGWRTYSRNPGFTETRLRPLARRRASTARPLLVFIRLRNPCVLERRRRLGWNVLFGNVQLLLAICAVK